MADKAKEFEKIEVFKEKRNISAAVFEGMKASTGWKTGKEVTEEEFDAACKAFLNAPVDGRKTEVKKKCTAK